MIHRCLTLHISGVASAGGGPARCEEAARFPRLAEPDDCRHGLFVASAERREAEEVAGDEEEEEQPDLLRQWKVQLCVESVLERRLHLCEDVLFQSVVYCVFNLRPWAFVITMLMLSDAL